MTTVVNNLQIVPRQPVSRVNYFCRFGIPYCRLLAATGGCSTTRSAWR